jgi:sugar lactone lactonase YvrE
VVEPLDSALAFAFAELAGELNHPEGVTWNPSDGRVYAGGEGGEIYAVTLEGEVTEVARSGGSMLGLAVDGRGRVYACDAGNGEVVRWAAVGGLEVVARGPGGHELDTPNTLAFDPRGALYVTCSGEDGAPSVMRVVAGVAEAEVWVDGSMDYPNGCAVSAAGDVLYVVDSHGQSVFAIAIEEDGSAGGPQSVASMPDTDADGLALDADGALWVTLYRPDGIVRIGRDGAVQTVVDDHLARIFDAPTNLAFVGPELDRAVVANVGDRFLSIGDLGVRGQALHYPGFD